MSLGYAMYDADNHLYESNDAFTRHLPEHRRRDVYWMSDERGHRHLVFDRRVYDYIPNPTFDPVAVAGALDRRKVEPLGNHPEYLDRDARLDMFDQQGIEGALLFPTLINGLEEMIGEDVPFYYDVMWAYDRWLDEEWGFSYRDRIFATPMIPFGDPDRAVEMIEWALGRGVKAIDVAAAPALTASGYRSPADAMFDPFWARCAEAGVIVCAHAGANHYNRHSGDWTGHYEQRPFEDHTLDRLMNQGRAVSDYFAALVWQGTLTRFPNLRLMSVENRSGWAAPLLQAFRRFCRPGTLPEDPVDAFHRCVWISPHWEDDLETLTEQVPAERVVAGSDWPHYDSLADPASFAKYLDGFGDEVVRGIMRDNLRSLLSA